MKPSSTGPSQGPSKGKGKGRADSKAKAPSPPHVSPRRGKRKPYKKGALKGEKHKGGAGGRGYKLANEETREKFLNALRVGATLKIACEYVGIDQSTYCNMQKIVENGESKSGVPAEDWHFKFVEDVKQAMAAGDIDALLHLKNARRKYWAASAWHLERRHPKDYGRPWKQDEPEDPSSAKSGVLVAPSSTSAEDWIRSALAKNEQFVEPGVKVKPKSEGQ